MPDDPKKPIVDKVPPVKLPPTTQDSGGQIPNPPPAPPPPPPLGDGDGGTG